MLFLPDGKSKPLPLWCSFLLHVTQIHWLHKIIVPITIWLWLTVCHGKIHPFLIGKPSISMGHLYHGYVSHNQRVYFGAHLWFHLMVAQIHMTMSPRLVFFRSSFHRPCVASPTISRTITTEPPWISAFQIRSVLVPYGFVWKWDKYIYIYMCVCAYMTCKYIYIIILYIYICM